MRNAVTSPKNRVLFSYFFGVPAPVLVNVPRAQNFLPFGEMSDLRRQGQVMSSSLPPAGAVPRHPSRLFFFFLFGVSFLFVLSVCLAVPWPGFFFVLERGVRVWAAGCLFAQAALFFSFFSGGFAYAFVPGLCYNNTCYSSFCFLFLTIEENQGPL